PTRRTPGLLERTLEGQRVDARRHHPHVVSGGAVHSARARGDSSEDVAAADDDRDLHTKAGHIAHLGGDPIEHGWIDPVSLPPGERLPRQLQNDAAIHRAAGAGSPGHLPRLAHLAPSEPLDHDPFTGLGVHAVHKITDLGLAGSVLDEGLFEQTLLGVELLELALDDLVDDLGRLLLVGQLAAVDLPLLLDDLARNVLARHV